MRTTPEQYTFIREALQRYGDPGSITEDPVPQITGEATLDALAMLFGVIRNVREQGNDEAAVGIAPAAIIVGQYAVRHGYITLDT